MRMRALLSLLLMLGLCLPAHAVLPGEMLADPALEARARALSQDLRCLVCQNQSIDDSDAQLARDLRVLVRERLKAGDTDDQVTSFLVARYGEFVLLTPRFGWHTVALWGAPLAFLLIGAGTIAASLRRRRLAGEPPPAVPLSDDEKAKLEAALRS
nr:cytochrome c-type biogenesis protein [Phreatobacter aquaticus]